MRSMNPLSARAEGTAASMSTIQRRVLNSFPSGRVSYAAGVLRWEGHGGYASAVIATDGSWDITVYRVTYREPPVPVLRAYQRADGTGVIEGSGVPVRQEDELRLNNLLVGGNLAWQDEYEAALAVSGVTVVTSFDAAGTPTVRSASPGQAERLLDEAAYLVRCARTAHRTAWDRTRGPMLDEERAPLVRAAQEAQARLERAELDLIRLKESMAQNPDGPWMIPETV